MQILSALDAISPAFSRTKLVLFSPFRKGRTWKLAVTGYLTIFGTVFVPYFLIGLFLIPMVRQSGGSAAVGILVMLCVAGMAVYLVCFYLCSRLRFVFFDIVLNRGEFIAPAWRKYGAASLKWTMLKIAFGTVATAAVAVPVAAWVRHIIPIFAALPSDPAQQQSPALISAMFTMYGAIFVVYIGLGFFYLISGLMSDFIVPSLALEDTTLGEAFTRLGKLVRNEPGQVMAYAAVKVGLGIAGYMAQTILIYIVILLVMLIVGVVAFLAYFLLHALHISAAVMSVLVVLGMIVGGMVYAFVFFYLIAIGVGTVMTFLEAYTLYFLGGRYPLLGNLLDQSTPPRPVFTPPPGYPAYYAPPPPQ